MIGISLFLIIGLISVRAIECYLFIKRVSKACNKYDWKYVNDGNDLLLLEIIKEDYYVTSEWSAYNFVYLKGPSALSMFFSMKPITIKDQYNKEVINKLNKYEVI